MWRHELDLTSLVAGLLFAVVGVFFLLDATDSIDLDVAWVPPVLLVGLGVAGLASALRTSERRTSERHTSVSDSSPGRQR